MRYTPRRSCLYMPGANAKALEKGRSLPADVLIFDLEDSVAPEAKEDARAAVVAALRQGGYGEREIVVRVNALSTPWGFADVEAAVEARATAILFPKIDGPADIVKTDSALASAGARGQVALWAMIETPKAILKVCDIAEMAASSRLQAFVVGTNDLAKDMRARLTPSREAFLTALSLTIVAARIHNLDVIDGVYNDLEHAAGFAAECRQGADLGFDGKTLVHPTQIAPANQIFAPDPAEVARARAVIAAFAAPENAGKGVLRVDGKMAELLHLEQSKRLVAMAEAIAARGG